MTAKRGKLNTEPEEDYSKERLDIGNLNQDTLSTIQKEEEKASILLKSKPEEASMDKDDSSEKKETDKEEKQTLIMNPNLEENGNIKVAKDSYEVNLIKAEETIIRNELSSKKHISSRADKIKSNSTKARRVGRDKIVPKNITSRRLKELKQKTAKKTQAGRSFPQTVVWSFLGATLSSVAKRVINRSLQG
ncbi:hypothetical protein KAFR_0K00410 [Kazachstania africana CBS 2517]|uniref:Uncharacterized protein n=1 Tax=Kazachstania africana (strain ATCC 22294 / BCRC 22015 / CBS 2517 / CECT 1963 / NBRC 1671 / NRRL Y-8276) TaxID=1071382 RepID=H2B196_KAZAF|nr:hypothetical protein KAFR_0K00410 [Kazachstania africana CBS 2517]CCF60396.1 hypothetical protein KAFR_0K00410 [Kazachstania africana CBS 2517]